MVALLAFGGDFIRRPLLAEVDLRSGGVGAPAFLDRQGEHCPQRKSFAAFLDSQKLGLGCGLCSLGIRLLHRGFHPDPFNGGTPRPRVGVLRLYRGGLGPLWLSLD